MVRREREVTEQGRISMTARKELIQAVGAKYRGASRSEKQKIPPRQNSFRLDRTTPGAAKKEDSGKVRTNI